MFYLRSSGIGYLHPLAGLQVPTVEGLVWELGPGLPLSLWMAEIQLLEPSAVSCMVCF